MWKSNDMNKGRNSDDPMVVNNKVHMPTIHIRVCHLWAELTKLNPLKVWYQ